MRAQYASWVDAWPTRRSPSPPSPNGGREFIADADDQLIGRIAFRANEDGKHKAEKIELLKALFAAKFVLEGGSQPDGLWHDLVVDALERNDLRRAREISKRIQGASTLLHMRADRRFDALVKAEPRTFNLSAARGTRVQAPGENRRRQSAFAGRTRAIRLRAAAGRSIRRVAGAHGRSHRACRRGAFGRGALR